jgi:DNA invertase Pin-like site-specific DNA recombinase
MTRFAFYGRVSTEDQQDPASSRAWQMRRAEQLIEPAGGQVVAEFFDIGLSRSLPWKRRPEATRLLAAFKDKRRQFDAVVIGEPQRAFYGNQFGLTFPVFVHYGVQLWVPEVGGAVDPGSDAHDLVMSLYGGMSKGERNRIKLRVRSAMAAQAATEGRFLGGRPPYGYQLADAGPHPNPGKAAAGQRAHRLEIDPIAAPIVKRIFADYLAGNGLHAVAEGLNRDGVPSPSAHDRARNRHRSGVGWSKSAIRAILSNARYTGREVWNRQRRDEELIDVDDVALGHASKMRWNDRADWIWSAEQTHEAIISVEDYAGVQEHLGAGANRPAIREPRRTARPYALRGIVFCGECGRKMQGSWNHGRAHYRCTFAREYVGVRDEGHRAAIYVREDAIIPALDRWLAQLFDPTHIDETVAKLVSASEGPSDEDAARADAAQRTIQDCDRKLVKYREALDNGADASVVSTWIAETQGARLAALRELSAARPMNTNAQEFRDLLTKVGPIEGALARADATKKGAIYRELGVTMTYKPTDDVVTVEARPCTAVRVGGGL